MTMMNTTDGIFMSKAYKWAFENPLRKIFYNIATTGLSVAVALVIGTIELLQVFIGVLGLRGRISDFIASLDFGVLGYIIVGMFLLAWCLSVVLWKFRDTKEHHGGRFTPHEHMHEHEGGLTHSHTHTHR